MAKTSVTLIINMLMNHLLRTRLLSFLAICCSMLWGINPLQAQLEGCDVYHNFLGNTQGSVSTSPMAPVSVAYSCFPTPNPACGPTYIPSGCSDPGGIRFKSELTASPGTGEGIRVSKFIGINPQFTFLAGNTYNITMSVKWVSGSPTDPQLVLRAASAAQTSGACSGSCEVIGTIPIQGTCQSIIGSFTPSVNYEDLIISAISVNTGNIAPIYIEIDEICILNQTLPDCPEPQFSFEPNPCGNYYFINTSGGNPGLTEVTWTFTGPGLPSSGITETGDETGFIFPQSGTYTVTMCGVCEPDPVLFAPTADPVCTTQTITVVLDKTPPVIQNCPNTTLTQVVAPPCIYPFTFPPMGPTDENGISTTTYLYNGTQYYQRRHLVLA
jgi:hypothetical protein